MYRVFILKLRSVPESRKMIEMVPGLDPGKPLQNLHIVQKYQNYMSGSIHVVGTAVAGSITWMAAAIERARGGRRSYR